MSRDDDAPEREPLESDETSVPDRDPADDPDEDSAEESENDSDDDGLPFGIDVLGAAIGPQVKCPHSFDPQYCPFGCGRRAEDPGR